MSTHKAKLTELEETSVVDFKTPQSAMDKNSG